MSNSENALVVAKVIITAGYTSGYATAVGRYRFKEFISTQLEGVIGLSESDRLYLLSRI